MRILTFVFLFLLATAAAIVLPHRTSAGEGATATTIQDTIYLDRRISSLEQRLNSIESGLRNLENQAIISRSASAQPGRDPEVSLIRSELEILKGRATVLECGLMHLDERTLPASVKASRKTSPQQPADPCRQDPNSPLELIRRY